MRHRYLGTEHLLLALTAADGLAGAALAKLDVGYDAVRKAIVDEIGLGHTGESETLGITPRTKRTFESALREAKRLGSRCADNEDLLIALSSSDGVAAQILRARGAGPDDVRGALADLLEREAPELAAKLRTPPRRGLRRSRR
jgi:ATP-dependent Clp protease ATP-binding subunit ClpC